ncbi:MAG: thiamine phosphate synthase [Myxococcota bacterium]
MSWIHRRGLYAIVDPEHCAGRDPMRVARAILDGGCALLQLRAKGLPDGAWLGLARDLRTLCASRSVPFVLNDRADLAWLAGADGVHLGQDDLDVPDVRRIVGPDVSIGLSTHDEDQAAQAVAAGADLIGFGPIWTTRTKERPDPVVGLERLAAVARTTPLPVVAIGGLTVDRALEASRAGATFVAAISALCAAEDPTEAARAFHRAAKGTV